MVRLTCCLAVLVTLLMASSVSAVTLSGFALENFSSTGTYSDHVRIIATEDLCDKLSAKITLTPTKQLPLISYYEICWNNPGRGVDSVEVGRLFPVFGREWSDYRVDMAPLLNYSGINGPLVAVDTGISLSGHTRKFGWYTGIFTGDRIFGNAPGMRGQPDLYLRGTYQTNPTLILGASQRIGPVPASGADVLITKGRTQVTLEEINSKGISQEYAEGEYRLNNLLSVAGRHEWLQSGNRWGAALTLTLPKGFEVKLLRQTNPNQLFVQAAIRF